jgi:cytochrome c oxidase subunit IV
VGLMVSEADYIFLSRVIFFGQGITAESP